MVVTMMIIQVAVVDLVLLEPMVRVEAEMEKVEMYMLMII